MKQMTPDYAKPSTSKLGEEVNPVEAKLFPTKELFPRIITLAFAFLLFLPFAFAQKGTITGTVSSSEGSFQGATVSTGKTGVMTDKKGKFSISLNPGNHTLIITHVGYKNVVDEVTIRSGNTSTLDVNLILTENADEVTVLGSRSFVQRTSLNTAVPVDVFSAQNLAQTGQVSLTQMLNFSAPSLSASRPIANEAITLRGLNPDQVLILVNGTRRHSTAYITPGGLRGILGNGTVANDLNAIPFSAVEKIEVLRDGAAAQYGSDAIAGVINIQLKKSTDKTSVQLQTGRYYLGDGESISVGINRGISLHKKGFLNFSASFRRTNSTSRAGEYKGTVYKGYPRNATHNDSLKIKAQDDGIVEGRGFNRNQVGNAGSGDHTMGGIAINGGYPSGKKTEIFWTAIANSRKTTIYNGYTFPKDTLRVNPGLFPDGYGAHPYHYTTDLSGIAGIKGETKEGISWEYTSAYGNNTDKWYNKDVNNASQYYTLGKNSPSQFYTGTLIFGQLTNNVQASKNFSANVKNLFNLSIGAEWRWENFQMKEGDEASYKIYDSRKLGGVSGLVVSPENTVNKSRTVAGIYTDLEMEFAKRLLIDAAGRHEYYNDFGGNLAGKIATRYKFSDKFSIRGSFNNGFRAPSLQQRYYSATKRTGTTPVTNEPVVTGTFPNDHYVAKAFGVPSLQAERSLNISGGLTATLFNHIRVTADAYWIQVKDRIVLGGTFDKNSPAVRQILRSFPEVNSATFFSNAINTRTHGVDIVLNGNWKIQKANLLVMLAGNFTQTTLFGSIKTAKNIPPDSVNINALVDRYARGRLEHGQPDSKIIFLLNYKINKLSFLLRNTRFGKTAVLAADPTLSSDENFSPKILTDFSFSYAPKSWLTITAGANNIFDVYPDRLQDPANTEEGTFIYSAEASPFGFYGGYYFVSMSLQLQKH
jgi:iron complex outermembrane receptor protein